MTELLKVENIVAGYGDAVVCTASASRWRKAARWRCWVAMARARRP